MTTGRRSWLWECQQCGYLGSSLTPRIQDTEAQGALDEGRRAQALQSLRAENYEELLDRLAVERGERRGSLLDVGCAHGWFLKAAERRGYGVHGIEPDPVMRAEAEGRGLAVSGGFFPEDLPSGRTFDVIVFNDVFEHLPDPRAAMAGCAQRLNPRGHLVINIPSRRGIFYRVADWLDRIGVSGPFERMWQAHFASPHLSYFTPENLARLAVDNGFREAHRSTLRSIAVSDLWERLRYDRKGSVASAALVFSGVAALAPIVRFLPADISLQIFTQAMVPIEDTSAT